jgi:hypothetical protein
MKRLISGLDLLRHKDGPDNVAALTYAHHLGGRDSRPVHQSLEPLPDYARSERPDAIHQSYGLASSLKTMASSPGGIAVSLPFGH